MKIVTAAEMREIDRVTTECFGVPSLTLMENAGTAVADFVISHYPAAKRVGVICGKGNNGGDGFVTARKLLRSRQRRAGTYYWRKNRNCAAMPQKCSRNCRWRQSSASHE